MQKYLITKKGNIYLKKKLKELKIFKKPEIIKDLSIARDFGDLSENSEYNSAKKSLYLINKEIENLENFLSKCEIIEPENIKNKNIINFSATIELKNIEKNKNIKYKIVGDEEINLEPNSISINSPVAKILIGKSINDIIRIKQLNKIIKYKIISINYL
ncbi:Transcription elongation factor GreA [Candidatus Nasuia deltocephalinicola]|nr:Transcription elongation factor GreA [Candidatus Nasuia deltocephalinicola]